MKKAIVVYDSKYGHTKQYAKFISNSLNCEKYKLKEVTLQKLQEYDLIIYGGPVYQDMIYHVDKITYNLDTLEGKSIIIFADGILPVNDNVIRNLTEENFLDSDLEKIFFFYFRGGLNYDELKWEDQIRIDYDVNLSIYSKGNDKYAIINRLHRRKLNFVKEENVEELLKCARNILKED